MSNIEFKNKLKKNNQQACVIVSDRPWNKGMHKSLMSRSDLNFILISDFDELTYERLTSINPKLIFFPHWSFRIDSSIYENFECVIFHMTDLPFGRGGSPLQNLIIRGFNQTKITALRCTKEIDAGPIYLKYPLSLYGTAEEIFIRASVVIEEMIINILEENHHPVPQTGDPTYFKRRKPEDSNLEKANSLLQIFNSIRMLDANDYPNAFLKIGPFKLEFSRAKLKVNQVDADVRITICNNDME